MAIQKEKIDMVKLLLDSGAVLNIKNLRGNTSLDLAKRIKNKRIILSVKKALKRKSSI